MLPGAEILVIWDGPDDGTKEYCYRIGASAVKGAGKGLGPAIVKGIRIAKNDRVVVMDGDGQHPPTAAAGIASKLQQSPLVAGKRVEFAGLSPIRRFMSNTCRLLSKPLCPQRDIMTGLFGLDRRIIDLDSINTQSWKIGLEIFAKGQYQEHAEECYVFQPRIAGESKAGLKPALQFLAQLVRLYLWKIDLTQMMQFCIVGTSGLVVNMGVLLSLVELLGFDYRPAAVIGIGAAMVWNYLWNKFWTFRRRDALSHNRAPATAYSETD